MNLDFTEKHIHMTTAYVIFIYLTSNPMALHNMQKEIQKPFLPLKVLRLPAATHHPVPIFHTASGTSSIAALPALPSLQGPLRPDIGDLELNPYSVT